MTGPEPTRPPSPADEEAVRTMFAHLADDPDAPPTSVSALRIRAAAGRRGEARRRRIRTTLLAAAGIAVVALLVPVVLRVGGSSTATSSSSGGAQYTAAAGAAGTSAAASSAAASATGGGPAAPAPQALTPGDPAAAGSVTSAAGAASSAAASGASCAVPSLAPAAAAAVLDALPGAGGVLQEVAPAVLSCDRGGVSGTAFDVVAGEQAGSVQVSLLAAAPAECAAGCAAVAGTNGVLVRDDANGTVVAVEGAQDWVLVEQDLGNLSGLPPLVQLPYTPTELVAAGAAVLDAG